MTTVIHNEARIFWKAGCKLIVTIIFHHHFDVLEVVCFCNSKEIEAERLYLDLVALKDITVDNYRDHQRLHRSHSTENDTMMREKSLMQNVIKYVDDRLDVSLIDIANKVIHVQFTDYLFSEGSSQQHQVTICKPADLVPFEFCRSEKSRSDSHIVRRGGDDSFKTEAYERSISELKDALRLQLLPPPSADPSMKPAFLQKTESHLSHTDSFVTKSSFSQNVFLVVNRAKCSFLSLLSGGRAKTGQVGADNQDLSTLSGLDSVPADESVGCQHA